MNTYNPTAELESHQTLCGHAGLPDSPEMERELAREMREAFPDQEPTAEQLQADFTAKREQHRQRADALGIGYGVTRDGNGHRGYAKLPSGRRVQCGGRKLAMGDAREEAIFLGGRLADVLNAGLAALTVEQEQGLTIQQEIEDRELLLAEGH